MRRSLLDEIVPLPLSGDSPSTVRGAYPWPSGTWMRAMCAMTLNGAYAGSSGRSRDISSEADRALLAELRRDADAVIIGGETMRAERYTPMRLDAAAEQRRLGSGALGAPRLIVVSGSLDLPWDQPVWRESTVPPLVVTAEGAPGARLATARQHCEVVVLGTDPVPRLRDALVERGLNRQVCEGGPGMLSALTKSGSLDEIDMTLSPMYGGEQRNGMRAPESVDLVRFELAHAFTQDGFLFLRYLRRTK